MIDVKWIANTRPFVETIGVVRCSSGCLIECTHLVGANRTSQSVSD